MKKNSILKQVIMMFVLCTMLIGLVSAKGEASQTTNQEEGLKTFPLKTVMKREDRVKLRLTEENVSKYVIYRADAKEDGTLSGSYEKIMTMYGTNVSYVDEIEPGHYYSCKVDGYEKTDGKYEMTCSGKRLVYGGWWTMWDEYQHCDAKVTPTSIPLRVYAEQTMFTPEGEMMEEVFTPDGYVIYRKEIGGKYEKIAKFETKEFCVEHLDEKVETGTTYLYRARAYRYINGKKVFGIYTNPVRMSAVNRIGTYDYEILTPVNENTTGLKMKVTSDVNNGKLTMEMGASWCALSYYTEYGYEGEEIDVAMYLAEYSYDNENWTGFTEKGEELIIQPGETIYLRFEGILGQEFIYLGEEAIGDTQMICEEVTYNHLRSALWFGYGTFSAEVIGEYYH